MSGETEQQVSGWTIDTWRYHTDAMREAEKDLQAERDRRYTEVNTEREKALKIKETADLAALSLAREIQDYKDEKANNLRSQIEGERGHYATKEDLHSAVEKFELSLRPISEFVASERGRGIGVDKLWAYLLAVASLALTAGFLIHTLLGK